MTDLTQAFDLALTHCLPVRLPPPGVLSAAGSSTLDLLHRMSTQDLIDMAPGHTRQTVFTNALARVVDVVRVVRRAEDVLLITSPGREAIVSRWLSEHIFFQDDVRLAVTARLRHRLGFYGPQAADSLAGPIPGLPHLEPGGALEFPGGVAWKARLGEVVGIEVLCDPDAVDQLHPAGADLPGAQEAYEALRIEAGLPAFGREITEDMIPLEAGLWQAVSFTKGCYIGQEIIARMDSRGKLAKRLSRIRLSGPVQTPAVLTQNGSEVGQLTSAAESPRSGWVGLCIVRTARLAPGSTSVAVAGTGVVGELVEFSSAPEAEAPTREG